MLDLSIIIVSYNTKKLLEDCLYSIKENIGRINYEVIVVDNNSLDGSVELVKSMISEMPLELIEPRENLGFGKANNLGMKRSKGKYILLLNSDTVIKKPFMKEMMTWMDKHPKVAVTSCALRNADSTLQGTGGYFPTLPKIFAWMFFIEDIPFLDKLIKPFHPMHSHSFFYKGTSFFEKEGERDWVTGAFFLMRKEVMDEMGIFDPDYFMYTEEVDLCFRLKKKGWKVWYLPRWSIIHYGGASSTSEFPILSEYKGIKIFYQKRMPRWQYPFLRLFLKMGALIRIFLFGILKGAQGVKTYAKA